MDEIIQNTSTLSSYDIIINLMNQPDFRKLFDDSFNEAMEIKSVVLIMKTYHYIESQYIKTHGVVPSKEYMHSGIRKLMANSSTRKLLVESTNKFMQSNQSFDIVMSESMSNLLEQNM
tara:strand:+ start:6179 stop:6532 length:354 start_codon:yes stop_codon:yes gene_type:complete